MTKAATHPMHVTRLTTSLNGNGAFEVTSEHTPNLRYGVAYEGEGLGFCQCLDYQRHGSTSYVCKHLAQAVALIRGEQHAQGAASTPESREQARLRVLEAAKLFDL